MSNVLKIEEFHWDIPSQSSDLHDTFRPIARERKYLMDYKTFIRVAANCNNL